MKVVLAIAGSEAAESITEALRSEGFRVTIMGSMGGFLRRRNATLLIGVRDEQVDQVLQIIRENAAVPEPCGGLRILPRPKEESGPAVIVFVVNMPRFEHYQP